MAVFKRRCLFYLVEVTYSKSLVILLLVSITIVDGLINVNAANNKKEALKGENYTVHWNISNAKDIYRLKLYKNKTNIKLDGVGNWKSLELFTVHKTSISIKTFVESNKIYCMMTIYNVSYDDDASKYVMKAIYVYRNPLREVEETATFHLNVTGYPEFCGTQLPSVSDVTKTKVEFEICGKPKPDVKCFTNKTVQLPSVCELTEKKLNKYNCVVQIKDVPCGQTLYLESQGYRNKKLKSSSLLIADYTPTDLNYQKSAENYNLSWSVHHLGKACIEKYELEVNLTNISPLKYTTTTPYQVIKSKSIQSFKVRALCKWNSKSAWVTREIIVTNQSEGDNDFRTILICTIVVVLVVVLVPLVILFNIYQKRSGSRKPSSLDLLASQQQVNGPKAPPNNYEEKMFFAQHPQSV